MNNLKIQKRYLKNAATVLPSSNKHCHLSSNVSMCYLYLAVLTYYMHKCTVIQEETYKI